ncbi:MAG TPA: hypothetical protein VK579_06485, partial [Terriglobales bacterium]|nr:hypothetical protein [Terriglobales bacterium]
VFETTAVKMPANGTNEPRGGITTATTETTINGMTAKTADTGTGGKNGMRFIVPSAGCSARGREHIGSIATNTQIVTIAARSRFLCGGIAVSQHRVSAAAAHLFAGGTRMNDRSSGRLRPG